MPLYALWVSGEHIQKSAQAFVYGAWALFLVNTPAQLVCVKNVGSQIPKLCLTISPRIGHITG